jgi:hypothetical protein
MKLAFVFVAAALVIPAASSCAQDKPLTRAEVRSQLVQLEKSGYKPGGKSRNYPDDIQAAEAKVAAQNGQTAFGGVSDGSSESIGENSRNR